MAREAKAVDTVNAVWFTPAAFGNRKDKDPFRVMLKPMSAADYQIAAAVSVREMSQLSIDTNAVPAMLGKQVSDETIRKCVVDVIGYTHRRADGTVFVPKNGEQLLEAIYASGGEELDLRDELAAAIRDSAVLEAGVEKKSATPSATSAQTASPLKNGPVRSAAADPIQTMQTASSLSS